MKALLPTVKRSLTNRAISTTSTPSPAIPQARSIRSLIPNGRPEHVSERLDRIVGSNHFLRCIFYGVQDVSPTKAAKAAVETAAQAVTKTVSSTTKAIVENVKPSRFTPHTPPPHIKPSMRNIINRSRILQCIVYGVQENLATTSSTSTAKTSEPR